MLKNPQDTCKWRTQPITVRVLDFQQSFNQIKNTETEERRRCFRPKLPSLNEYT